MGTEIFTFSWRRLVHPFTDLDSIGFFDLIAQRCLRLNCRSGMRTYYSYTMSTRSSSLIYVPCFFLTLSHSASHVPFVYMGVRSETRSVVVYLRLYDICVPILTYNIIYIYRRLYTTHADKRHTYII